MKLIDYILLLIIAALVVIVLIEMKRGKGKCAYCSHKDSCPFKKKAEELKNKEAVTK